jgi:hypothetical protein
VLLLFSCLNERISWPRKDGNFNVPSVQDDTDSFALDMRFSTLVSPAHANAQYAQ